MNFFERIPERDLWSYLASSPKTVVMYGMGNGADKILEVCSRFGIEIADFFASDGFVRGHSFHGKTVLSYSAVKEKYGADNIIVLLSFGSSLPDVLELFRKVDSECELYAPDVPVCGGEIFTLDFFNAHKEEIAAVRDMLADETSLRIYDNVLLYKLTGKLSYLFAAECDKRDTYALIDASRFRVTADLGAYNGDTVRELKRYAPALERVFALEPDARTFKKLSAFCAALDGQPTVNAINAAAWNENVTLTFGGEGNRNSGLFAPTRTAKAVEVSAVAPDAVFGNTHIDFIKYDVEGAERQALLGSARTVDRDRPVLLVSAYHRSEDIFALPLLVRSLRTDYRLYYRRYPYVPAWDLELICL